MAGEVARRDSTVMLTGEPGVGKEEPLLPLSQATAEFQRGYIQRALERCGGNVSRAAKLLGVHRSALYRKQAVGRDRNGG